MFIKAYSPRGQFLSVVTIRCRPTGHSAPGTQYPLPLSRQRLTPPPDTPSANHIYNIPHRPLWHFRTLPVHKPRSRRNLSPITPPTVARGCCARGRISKIFRRTCPAPNPLLRCALLRARYTRRAARRYIWRDRPPGPPQRPGCSFKTEDPRLSALSTQDSGLSSQHSGLRTSPGLPRH